MIVNAVGKIGNVNCWVCNCLLDDDVESYAVPNKGIDEMPILCKKCFDKMRSYMDGQACYWLEDNKYTEPIDYDNIKWHEIEVK